MDAQVWTEFAKSLRNVSALQIRIRGLLGREYWGVFFPSSIYDSFYSRFGVDKFSLGIPDRTRSLSPEWEWVTRVFEGLENRERGVGDAQQGEEFLREILRTREREEEPAGDSMRVEDGITDEAEQKKRDGIYADLSESEEEHLLLQMIEREDAEWIRQDSSETERSQHRPQSATGGRIRPISGGLLEENNILLIDSPSVSHQSRHSRINSELRDTLLDSQSIMDVDPPMPSVSRVNQQHDSYHCLKELSHSHVDLTKQHPVFILLSHTCQFLDTVRMEAFPLNLPLLRSISPHITTLHLAETQNIPGSLAGFHQLRHLSFGDGGWDSAFFAGGGGIISRDRISENSSGSLREVLKGLGRRARSQLKTLAIGGIHSRYLMEFIQMGKTSNKKAKVDTEDFARAENEEEVREVDITKYIPAPLPYF
jgi:hypothetical protein